MLVEVRGKVYRKVSDLKETAGTEQISYEEDDNCLERFLSLLSFRKPITISALPILSINFVTSEKSNCKSPSVKTIY